MLSLGKEDWTLERKLLSVFRSNFSFIIAIFKDIKPTDMDYENCNLSFKNFQGIMDQRFFYSMPTVVYKDNFLTKLKENDCNYPTFLIY